MAKKRPVLKTSQAAAPNNNLTVIIKTSALSDEATKKLDQLKPSNGINYLLVTETDEGAQLPEHFEIIPPQAYAKKSFLESISDQVLYIDIDGFKDSINLNQVVQQAQRTEAPCILSFNETAPLNTNLLEPALLFNKDLFSEFLQFSTINPSVLTYHLNTHFANTLKATNTSTVKQSNVTEKINRPGLKDRILYWFNWMVSTPLTEIKSKGISFKSDGSIYRLLFSATAVVTFALMTIFCFDAGNSGDEITLIKQAEKSYNFFATMGEDRSAVTKEGRDPMYAYGQSFDLVTYTIAEWFGIDDIYALRHLMNTWIGWLAMLFTGLLAVSLMGWRAGFLAFVFISLSPRFLGHSWNNPKDIPFTFGFIFTLYFTFRFIKHLPKVSVRNLVFMALGLAFTNSIRIGGLLLIAYIGLFIGLKLISLYGIGNLLKPKNLKFIINLAKKVVLFLIGGYFLGILLWPFALLNPIKNPLEALDLMTNFEISLRQLFEGKIVWSDNLPWYYALKYMLYTIPLFIFAGVFFAIASLKTLVRKAGGLYIFLLLFIWLFPIIYTIYKDSNLYGGWRHLMFSYPPLVIMASVGFDSLFKAFKNKWVHYAISAIIIALAVRPAIHTFKNHPHQYVYYNEILGGIEGAWGKYELDYYFHSFKEASEWLIENELKDQFNPDKKIVVRTNAGAQYFFRDYKENVSASYMRYYERGNENWDYALVVNTYINPNQLKTNNWPPSNTIHTIDVDGYPICAILKRKTKKDLEAFQAFKARDYSKAVKLYNEALEVTPDNEAALLNLTTIYHTLGQLKDAESTAKKCLKVYPDYDRALAQLGVVYLAQGQLNNAAKTFTKTIQVNKKYGPAYYYMAVIYQNTGDLNTASQYANKAIEASPRYKPAYMLLGNILRAQGREQDAQRVFQAANAIK